MVNLALIGCGRWGRNYIRNLLRIGEAGLKICCDSSKERIAELVRYYPFLSFTTDPGQIVDNPEIQGVIIATPPATHYDLALRCLSAGQHVLVEKPLSLRLTEVHQLADQACHKKLVLMTGHILEYHPAIGWIKGYLQSDGIGEAIYIYMTRTNLGVVRNDVNVMWDLAVHDLAVLRYLIDANPQSVSAQGIVFLQAGIPDVVFLNLRYASGLLVQIHASWLDPLKIRRLTLIGTQKAVVFDDVHEADKLWIYDRSVTPGNPSPDKPAPGEVQFTPRYGDIRIPAINMVEPLYAQCKHFVDCIINQTPPLTGVKDSEWVVKVLELGQESLEQQGAIIPFRG